MQRIWIGLGALSGCGTVAMAAVAAHALSGAGPEARHLVESGVQIQGWHALALLAVGLWAPRGGRLADLAGVAFCFGSVLFCGAVYSHGIVGIPWGVVAPVGGTTLMIGWLLLAVSALFPRAR